MVYGLVSTVFLENLVPALSNCYCPVTLRRDGGEGGGGGGGEDG